MVWRTRKPAINLAGGDPIFIDRQSEIGILMFHGFTSTPRQFREFAPSLANLGYTVYAPSLAGHGTTPADLEKMSSEDWKNQAVADYLKIKNRVKKVFIVGVSFGGNIAFYLAEKFPTEVAGVISLGTPIYLRYQIFIKARIFLYGWMKRYYSKPRRVYRTDYTDMADEMSYPVIPVKSLKRFLQFIQQETIPSLEKIKTPVMIMHANNDSVVNPRSAQYLYENLRSPYKLIYWFDSNTHSVVDEKIRRQVFEKINEFIKEINQLPDQKAELNNNNN